MNRDEISGMIEDRYAVGHSPTVTRVMCKDDITFYGYFNSFGDYTELKEKNQYRFIPRNNFKAFRDEHNNKGIYSTKHSIIINGDEVIDIEFVLPVTVEV
ncbi:MAG TPA: hypothetical protein VNZ45_11630 [Bacteroidia bacterium]|jgi:hypothetical protein|nr:hypothetical protein [Bacteroidia bacterium]